MDIQLAVELQSFSDIPCFGRWFHTSQLQTLREFIQTNAEVAAAIRSTLTRNSSGYYGTTDWVVDKPLVQKTLRDLLKRIPSKQPIISSSADPPNNDSSSLVNLTASGEPSGLVENTLAVLSAVPVPSTSAELSGVPESTSETSTALSSPPSTILSIREPTPISTPAENATSEVPPIPSYQKFQDCTVQVSKLVFSGQDSADLNRHNAVLDIPPGLEPQQSRPCMTQALQLVFPPTSSPEPPPFSPITMASAGTSSAGPSSTSPTIPAWLTRVSQNNTDFDNNATIQPYSKTQYKKDAVFILILLEAIAHNEFTETIPLIRESDYSIASVIVQCLDAKKRQEWTKGAKEALRRGTHCATQITTFTHFLNKFRNGPSSDDSFIDEETNRPQAGDNSLRNNHHNDADTHATEPRTRGKKPVRRDGEVEIRRSHTRDTRSQRFSARMESVPPSDPSSSDSVSSYLSHRRRGKTRGSQTGRSSRQPSDHPVRLKPEYVSFFDPKKTSVVSFTKRLQQLARRYGKSAVLDVVPLCLKGEACDWYTHLSDDITDLMESSLSECVFQLERRFKKNVFEARRNADKLKFRFAKETDLSLREYVEKKVMLLREANIFDESEIVYRVWENLDATLMNVIRPERFSLDEFTDLLYRQEVPAQLAWQQTRTGSTAGRKAGRERSSNTSNSATNPTDTPKTSTSGKSTSQRKTPKVRLRDCCHYGGPHFDFDCPTRNLAIKVYFVSRPEDSEKENKISEADKKALRNIRASLDRSTSDSSSDSDNSKN